MEYDTCPVCNGSGFQGVIGTKYEWYLSWNGSLPGFDRETGLLECQNCGAQTMGCQATGKVKVDPATGKGCVHDYKGVNAGRCYTRYTCTKCGDEYHIDSGD